MEPHEHPNFFQMCGLFCFIIINERSGDHSLILFYIVCSKEKAAKSVDMLIDVSLVFLLMLITILLEPIKCLLTMRNQNACFLSFIDSKISRPFRDFIKMIT